MKGFKAFCGATAMAVIAAAAISARGAPSPPVAKTMMGLPLVFQDDFESGKADRWEPTDPKAWKVAAVDGNHVYWLYRSSKYRPKVRSPYSISWVKGLSVSDFVIEAKLKQTGKEYGHRDMCLFFGRQDPEHFYYVHIATRADAHANSIFIVNGKPRVSIAEKRTSGTAWGKGWHKVRIVRKVADGTIEVYFDNMQKPIMIAHDKTFVSGTVGVGSFDDVGMVDDFRVWARQAGK